MLFYKVDGFIVNENWAEENNNRRAIRENARRIAVKSASFNQQLNNTAFYYVVCVAEDTVTVGAILRESGNFEKQLNSFFQALDMQIQHTTVQEVTFQNARNMLIGASRSDYIENGDEILKQFELHTLSDRSMRCIEFGENILTESSKKAVYEAAGKYLAKEPFIAELNRIYAGKTASKGYGHPVHYMIQTDDIDARKEICKTLLQALYANNRLSSKRYCFVDFKPCEDFSIIRFDYLYKSCFGGAIVIRYLANDDSEDDRAYGEYDIIENICKVVKKYRHQVLTVFCLPRECTKFKSIFYERLGNISIVELAEEFISGERAIAFLKMLAKNNGVRTDKKLFVKLEDEKGYLAPDLHDIFDEWYNNKLKTSIYPQYKEIVTAKREVIKAAPKGSAYDELQEMIGLKEAKTIINQALNYYKAQNLFAEKGMKTDRPAMHMVFTGNPGTAKTTVARLFARIMKENNLLSKGQLIEVGRGDLVGKYVGWTAPTIQRKFREAMGGVLFIDEAYSLVDDRDGSYGDEAINTIVQEMENHNEDVVVIFAGYPDKMEGFLRKNPGLRSRIAFHIPFADYTVEELCEIARLIASKKGLKITDEAYQRLSEIFEAARTQDDFGNGRFVRNVIEKAKMAQASRLLQLDFDRVTLDDVFTLCAGDIEMPVFSKQPRRQIGFSA